MPRVATEFRKEFKASPVPIRLSCRFSNGISLNYYARAVSCTNRVLRVLSVNPFEQGIQLVIAAPFLEGLTRCRVVGVSRSNRQASSFDLELRFVDLPSLASLDDAAALSFLEEAPLLSEDIAAAASALSAGLQSTITLPFAEAFQQSASSPRRQLALLATIAATLLLLHEKGFYDLAAALNPRQTDIAGGDRPSRLAFPAAAEHVPERMRV